MSTLKEAVTAIKAGDRQTGRRLLLEIVQADPKNEQAWLWMTQTVSTVDEKRRCLERVLEINPQNEMARKGLATLPPAPSPPPESAPAPPRRLRSLTSSTPKPAAPPPPAEDTRQCPYCAETIKAQATVCRFCGRDLIAKPPPPNRLKSDEIAINRTLTRSEDRQLMDEAVARYIRRGWQLVSQNETSLNLRKPKNWSALLLIGGVITLPVFGVGVVILILAVVDYLLRSEQTMYVTVEELRNQTAPSGATPTNWALVVLAGLALLLCVMAMAMGN